MTEIDEKGAVAVVCFPFAPGAGRAVEIDADDISKPSCPFVMYRSLVLRVYCMTSGLLAGKT